MSFDPPLQVDELEITFLPAYTDFIPIFTGGQSSVFKALHKDSGKIVALKIYFANHVDQRSQREVEFLSKNSVESLVKFIDAGEIELRKEKCIYLTTEFIQGEVLSSKIKQSTIPFPTIVQCALDISIAIDALWTERIVHRDIKPDNIMIKNDNSAILIDLGIARHLNLGTLTATGFTWGTQGYLSPEQAKAVKQLSCKSDIFSLGITLQECITSRHPVNHRQDLLRNGGPLTQTSRHDIPKDFCCLIDEMVQIKAHERPSPVEIQERLKHFI